jgi:hypothetical protein
MGIASEQLRQCLRGSLAGQNTGHTDRWLGFKSHYNYFLAVQPWACHIASLCCSFLLCKMIITRLSRWCNKPMPLT